MEKKDPPWMSIRSWTVEWSCPMLLTFTNWCIGMGKSCHSSISVSALDLLGCKEIDLFMLHH